MARSVTITYFFLFFFFFFQAEDGIRDLYVTGVQTCALPISVPQLRPQGRSEGDAAEAAEGRALPRDDAPLSPVHPGRGQDRKSTRLNSSHVEISYAVFCLKKKNTRKPMTGIAYTMHSRLVLS